MSTPFRMPPPPPWNPTRNPGPMKPPPSPYVPPNKVPLPGEASQESPANSPTPENPAYFRPPGPMLPPVARPPVARPPIAPPDPYAAKRARDQAAGDAIRARPRQEVIAERQAVRRQHEAPAPMPTVPPPVRRQADTLDRVLRNKPIL